MKRGLLVTMILFLFVAPVVGQQRIDLSRPVTGKVSSGIQWPGADAATKGLGFFCRQEIKMDKQTAMPVRFRLGSMQQTDWLEQKPNTVKPDR